MTELETALDQVANRIIPESEWWAGWQEYLVIVEAARREANAQIIVDEQAEDEGLGFQSFTAPEAYLQQELRRLHAALTGDNE